MPARPALMALSALAAACAVAGCVQPGTQASKPEAAKLAVGTGDISIACGYIEQLTAFGAASARQRGSIESTAETGARKLAAVYARDRTGIYQGDSIGGVLGDSVSLLHDCGLARPARILQEALARHH